MSNKRNRRDFLRRTTVGTTTLALGAVGTKAQSVLGANERIAVAIIGCGGRGMGYGGKQIQALSEKENAHITAVCDVWRKNRERAVNQVKEWFDKIPFSTTRYAEILAREDIDAVYIATPDFAHSPILADAARAKKDAYCEKPMATTLYDARDALHAVRDHEIVCQIGTQRRSSGHHKAGARFIQSGVMGKISEVETAWHDASPRWMKSDYKSIDRTDVDWEQYQMKLARREFNPMRFRCWHLWKDYTVGTPGLLGSHLIDVATWFMDDPLPLNAVANGGVYVWNDGREHADTLDCVIEYPKKFIVGYSTRLGNKFTVPEAIFYGLNGTFDTRSWTARKEGGRNDSPLKESIKIKPEPGENHVQNWLQCIRSRRDPSAPIEAGYAHSIASILCFLSWEHGQRYSYDSSREAIYPG